MSEMTIGLAKQIVWKFLKVGQRLPSEVDVMIVLGSRDDRVAQYAAELTKQISVGQVVISGGSAHYGDLLEAPEWDEASEAEHFAAVMQRSGYQEELLLEMKATNTGQNVVYTQELLTAVNADPPASLLIVTKPYMERRALKTFQAQWTFGKPKFFVSSQGGELGDYVNNDQPERLVTNIMVGDLQRVIEYPALGYMAPSHVPKEAEEALARLIQAGYNRHTLHK